MMAKEVYKKLESKSIKDKVLLINNLMRLFELHFLVYKFMILSGLPEFHHWCHEMATMIIFKKALEIRPVKYAYRQTGSSYTHKQYN
jgi:hypothetical protein